MKSSTATAILAWLASGAAAVPTGNLAFNERQVSNMQSKAGLAGLVRTTENYVRAKDEFIKDAAKDKPEPRNEKLAAEGKHMSLGSRSAEVQTADQHGRGGEGKGRGDQSRSCDSSEQDGEDEYEDLWGGMPALRSRSMDGDRNRGGASGEHWKSCGYSHEGGEEEGEDQEQDARRALRSRSIDGGRNRGGTSGEHWKSCDSSHEGGEEEGGDEEEDRMRALRSRSMDTKKGASGDRSNSCGSYHEGGEEEGGDEEEDAMSVLRSRSMDKKKGASDAVAYDDEDIDETVPYSGHPWHPMYQTDPPRRPEHSGEQGYGGNSEDEYGDDEEESAGLGMTRRSSRA